MAFWKQLLLAAVLLVVALVGWLWFVPGSGQTLARLGVPQALVSACTSTCPSAITLPSASALTAGTEAAGLARRSPARLSCEIRVSRGG